MGTYSLHGIQTGSLKLLVCFCFSCVTCINTEKFPVLGIFSIESSDFNLNLLLLKVMWNVLVRII